MPLCSFATCKLKCLNIPLRAIPCSITGVLFIRQVAALRSIWVQNCNQKASTFNPILSVLFTVRCPC